MFIFNGMGAVNADKISTIEIMSTKNSKYYKVIAFTGGNEFTLYAAKNLEDAELFIEKLETMFKQYYVVTTTEEIGRTVPQRAKDAADKLGEFFNEVLT